MIKLKDPKEVVEQYRNNELEMDDVFVEMFGEKYARSMFADMYLDFEMYTSLSPEKYKTKESKKELITELLSSKMDYLENKDSVWYE